MQNAETVLSVLREQHGIVAGEPGDQKWSRRVREGGLGKGPQGTSPRPYLSRPDWREGPSREAPLSGSVSRVRGPNHRARRQGRCLRVLQGLPSRGDRDDPHARLGARRDARLAPAIRQATLVNRLVSHTRRPARRRGTQTLARWGLAATLHGHRHVRDLGCGLGRRPFREVIRPRKGGAFPGRPGTYVAGWQRCPLSAPTLSTATTRVRTAGTSSPSRTPRSCSSASQRMCTDLQGLRELTANGLDAINAHGPAASGRIVWDMDWLRFDASGGRVRKLSVTDTGTGMTAEQLHRYINQLASSGREQSAAGNFGVGAKVAAGSRNPHGLEYRSWHQGQGSWCASSDTPTAAGDSNRNAGRTATPTTGAHSPRRTSLGFCAARIMAPKWCCSASMSATTPPRRHRASPTPAAIGSAATSTPGSCASQQRSRSSSASNTTARSADSCSPSTASNTTSSDTPTPPVSWS